MKNNKRIFRITLCVVLALITVFSMASCDKITDTIDKILGKHEHSYTATVTDGDCESKGYITYTCECGDSYKEETDYNHAWYVYAPKEPTCTEKGYDVNKTCLKCGYTVKLEIAALGHDYEEKVTRFPTPLSVGLMSKICAQCGTHEDTPIDAVTFTMPGIADTLKSFIGNNKTVINARDTEIIHINEIHSGDDVTYEKQYTAVKVAYIEINGEGESLYANVHLEIGTATYDTLEEGAVPTFESESDISVIVNGESVAVAVTKNGESSSESYNLTDMFYQSLASELGISYEMLTEIVYVLNEESDALAILMGAINSTAAATDGADLSGIAQAIIDGFVDIDGNNYKVDFTNLSDLLATLKDKTVADLIEDAYGAGTMAKVEDFMISLPNLKIRDVVARVETFAKESGADIDELYKLVNYVVYIVGGTDFNIESEIIKRYDSTVIEVVAELTGADANTLATDFVGGINEVLNVFKTSGIDGIYNLVKYGDKDYSENGEIYSIIDTVSGVIGGLNDYINVTWRTDESGKTVYADAEISDIIPIKIHFNYALTDGTFTSSLDVTGSGVIVSIAATGNPENDVFGATVDVYKEDNQTYDCLVFSGTLTYTNNGEDGKVIEFKGYEDDELVALIRMTAVATENGFNVTYDIEGITVTLRDTEYIENGGTNDSGVPENYDGSEVTIVFYHTMGSSLRQVLDEYISKFNELYPNINVVHTQVGSYDDVRDQIRTELTAGNQPNIAYCYPDHVALYNVANAVVPLDEWIANSDVGFTEAELADFIDGFYDEGRQYGDGKMYTLPMSKSTELLYYNKTFFEQNNLTVPTTWDEMEALCHRIKEIDPSCTPLAYDSESNWFITMCEQLGTPYTSATGEHYLFDNSDNHEFVKRFREWYQNGYVTTQEILGSYSSDIFTKQTCYMSIASSAGATYQRPSKNSDGTYLFEVGIAPIPQINPDNPKAICQGPSLCLFKQDNSQEVAASWLFMKFLTTNPEFQADFSITSGYMPVIESVRHIPLYDAFLNYESDTNITAYALKTSFEQLNAFFTTPAFNGSSVARDEVRYLMVECLLLPPENLDDAIRRAFASAVEKCKMYD